MNEPTRNLAYLLIAAIATGCSAKAEMPAVPPRPVTFVVLETSNPSATTRLTGSAESWKREELAFEVPGRVIRIVEPGANIVGRTLDEKGNPMTEGTQLAQLDEERYQLALKQAESGAAATRTELELQQKQLARYKGIQAENPGAVSQQTIDRYDAAVMGATAELDVFLAQIEQAKRNIRDCKLVSPFTGQVARVHVIPGGYAFRGIPVLTVQMMDPIKVNVAVSPETDKRINSNDIIHVFTPSGEELAGLVYLKDTFADPTTRTFLVTLLVRNHRIEQGVPDDLRDKPIPRCRNLWELQRPEGATSGNYYVDVDAIQQDDEGHYVWKAENLTLDQMSADFSPVVTVRKVRVTAGEGRIPALQIFTFREITDLGGLDPKKDVIVGGVTGKLEDGGQVILVRERWALRPGDVVRVGLKGKEVPEGFYVPEQAIQFDGGKHFVIVAKPVGDGHEASRVAVTVAETVVQRIEPVREAELAEGAKVIVEGAHYLQQGDAIRPVDEVQPTP